MSDSPKEGSAQHVGEVDPASIEIPCAELKAAMEKCVVEKGEEKCQELTQAYKECMKSLGIQI
ncbi:hypothetical protein FKM82_029194 [Ascaphus truei]